MKTLYRLRDWSLRKANFNVVLSNEMQTLLEQRAIASKHFVVVPNWADPDQIRPLAHSENPLREQWGLVNKFVVGYSGNMGIAHDLDTIVEAATLLRDRTDIVFVMIGSGFRKNFMIVDVQARNLERSVLFKPYQPRSQLMHSLGVADIHIVSLRPSMEGLVVPSKFYGVCAAGRPVLYLGDSNGYIGRKINSVGCGQVISEGGHELATAIKQYTQAPERSIAEGAAARLHIGEKHSVVTAAQTWMHAFNNTVRQ